MDDDGLKPLVAQVPPERCRERCVNKCVEEAWGEKKGVRTSRNAAQGAHLSLSRTKPPSSGAMLEFESLAEAVALFAATAEGRMRGGVGRKVAPGKSMGALWEAPVV